MEKEQTAQPYLIFIVALSLLALAALVAEMMLPLDPASRTILAYADTIICALFLLDFLLCLHRAKDKKRYLLTWGWLDLISSIPALPLFRWGRAIRLVRILRVLRVMRSGRVLVNAVLAKRAQSGLLTAVLATILLIVTGSIAVLSVEQVEGANIKTAQDALWWSVTTMTTVGYGDRYPVTSEGRLIAAFLMFGGVGLFGVLSGFIATMFIKPSENKEASELEAVRQELAHIRRQLETLGAGATAAISTTTAADLPAPEGGA